MTVLVKALGYYSHKGGKEAKGFSKLKAHLKYLEHGKTPLTSPRDSPATGRMSPEPSSWRRSRSSLSGA